MVKKAADELTRPQIKAAITRNRKQLEEATAKVEALYAERDDLYLTARDADPPIVVREIAKLAGVTEVAVNKQVAKIRKERAGSAA